MKIVHTTDSVFSTLQSISDRVIAIEKWKDNYGFIRDVENKTFFIHYLGGSNTRTSVNYQDYLIPQFVVQLDRFLLEYCLKDISIKVKAWSMYSLHKGTYYLPDTSLLWSVEKKLDDFIQKIKHQKFQPRMISLYGEIIR